MPTSLPAAISTSTHATPYQPDAQAKPLTYPQRASVAVGYANNRFGFTDEKRMLATLSEIAYEEMSRNPSFALRVRDRYEELASHKAATSSRTTKAKPAKPKLVPIKELPGFQLDAARKLDPWFILEYFGKDQLETALRMQTISNLREAIAIVQEHDATAQFTGKVTKESAIQYILQYVLG